MNKLKTMIWLAIFILGAFFLGLVGFANSIDRRIPTEIKSADGIIALTGSQLRIKEAAKLLSAGHGKRVLITGVNPATSPKALRTMSPELDRLFECCIDIDKMARNTIGNAEATRDWAKRHNFSSLIIVTSSYHMPRSLVELRRALPDTELIPFPVSSKSFKINAWWAYPGTMRLIVSEYLKFLPAVARLAMTRLTNNKFSPISTVPAYTNSDGF